MCDHTYLFIFFCLSAFRQSLVGSKLHLIMFHTFFFSLPNSQKSILTNEEEEKIIRHNYECLTMRYIHIHDLFFLFSLKICKPEEQTDLFGWHFSDENKSITVGKEHNWRCVFRSYPTYFLLSVVLLSMNTTSLSQEERS